MDRGLVTVPCLFSYAEECKNIKDIPDAHRLNIKNILVKHKKLQINKETKTSPAKETQKNEESKIPKETEENLKTEDENGVFVAKLIILRLFDQQSGASKSYQLCHAFSEPFNIIQIYIKVKENLVYTLCENKNGEQFITVWNFKKKLML